MKDQKPLTVQVKNVKLKKNNRNFEGLLDKLASFFGASVVLFINNFMGYGV